MAHKRTITSCGNSLAVCIPKEYADHLGVKKGDSVILDYLTLSGPTRPRISIRKHTKGKP